MNGIPTTENDDAGLTASAETLAITADLLLALAQRLLSPWVRARAGSA